MSKLNSNITVTGADTFADSLGALYADWKESLGDSYLAAQMEAVAALSAELTEAVNRSAYSSRLDEADAVRDEAVRRLFTVAEGYAAFPFEAQRAAAEAVLAVLNRYGRSVTTASFAKESSLIESMLGDLAEAPAKEGIAALAGVAELVDAVRAAETAFKEANKEFTKTVAAGAGKRSATAVKKELVACLNDRLLPYLAAMSLARADAYGGFAREVETELARANASVARRGKKKAAADAAPEAEA